VALLSNAGASREEAVPIEEIVRQVEGKDGQKVKTFGPEGKKLPTKSRAVLTTNGLPTPEAGSSTFG
jgi:hypothetical protein